jgi:hypothetical protein
VGSVLNNIVQEIAEMVTPYTGPTLADDNDNVNVTEGKGFIVIIHCLSLFFSCTTRL